MITRFTIPLDRIPSVNELYVPDLNNGGFYINPDVARLMDQLRTFMADHYPKSNFSHLNRNSILEMSYDFILRKGIGRRDVSNMLKMTEDTICRYVGVDDSQVVILNCRKSENRQNIKEYVVVTINDNPQITPPDMKMDPIIIPLQYIPSINDMYAINQNAKCEYKKPYIHREEANVKKYLSLVVNRRKYYFMNNGNRFKCHYDFFMKRNSQKRDVSNCLKFIEDSIFRFFNVDDSRVLEIVARKFAVLSTQNEYVAFMVEPSTHDISSFSG